MDSPEGLAGAINVRLYPIHGRIGATTRAGGNETSSRPPNDLGGALRYALALAKRRYRRSYDAAPAAA